MTKISAGEEYFADVLDAAGIEYEREFKFAAKRKRRYRADFRITHTQVLVEIEGGAFSRGRHTRGVGFSEDCTKYNLAHTLKWIPLRYTTEQIQNRNSLQALKDILACMEIETDAHKRLAAKLVRAIRFEEEKY